MNADAVAFLFLFASTRGHGISTSVLANLGILFVSVAIAGATFWMASRSARSQAKSREKSVDAGAYKRAEEIYERAITQLRATSEVIEAERDSLRASNVDLQGQVTRLRNDIGDLHMEIGQLRMEVRSLKRTNENLSAELAALRGPA